MLRPIFGSKPKFVCKATADLCNLVYKHTSQIDQSDIPSSLTCGPGLCSHIISSSINFEPNFVCSGLEGCAVALTVREIGQDRSGTCVKGQLSGPLKMAK